MLQICQNIAQARLSRGLSQEKMAEQVGVKRATYKNWEAGTEPGLSEIKTIAKALEIPAYKLLEGVIEFETGADKREPVTINAVLEASQIDKIRLSLSVLDAIFSPDPGSGKGKNQDREDLEEFGGRKKSRSGAKKKVKPKGT
jgi:transcriptional regulator with XRE-family HTH domain